MQQEGSKQHASKMRQQFLHLRRSLAGRATSWQGVTPGR
jgi:hypothetical protein